jgi:hypothetical protein
MDRYLIPPIRIFIFLVGFLPGLINQSLYGLTFGLAVDPASENVISSDSSSIQGSGDGGANWQPCAPISSMAREIIDDHHGTLFLLDENSILWKSTDSGKHWERIVARPPLVNHIAIDAHGELFASVYRTGFVSIDRENYSLKKIAYTNWMQQISCLAIDASDRYYAGTSTSSHDEPGKDGRGRTTITTGGGIYRSLDKGVSWKPLAFQGYQIYGCRYVSAAVYVIAQQNMGWRLYRLRDNASVWDTLNPGDQDVESFTVFGRDTIYIGTYDGVWRSFDGGKHFHQVNQGLTDGHIKSIDCTETGDVYATTSMDLFVLPQCSTNWRKASLPGHNWIGNIQVANSTLFCSMTSPSRQENADDTDRSRDRESKDRVYRSDSPKIIYHLPHEKIPDNSWVLIPSKASGHVKDFIYDTSGYYLVNSEKSTESSTDNGATWMACRLPAAPPRDIYDNNNFLSFDRASKRLYYSTGSYLYCSTDRGLNWQEVSGPGAPSSGIMYEFKGLAVGPGGMLSLAVGMQEQEIFVSRDMGGSWVRVPSQFQGIRHLAFDQDGTIYASGMGKIYRIDASLNSVSEKGRSVFTPTPPQMDNICYNIDAAIRSFTISDNGTLLASRIDHGLAILLHSKDHGDTWSKLSTIGNEISAIITLSEKTIAIGTNIGVFISNDEGRSWYPLDDGLLDTRIDYLELQPGGYLVAVTATGRIQKTQKPIRAN